jgi:hypothetical protein
MASYIGFDRRIALAWLDETAGQMLRDPDPAAVRAHLHSVLAPEVTGREARVKTITLLCRVWVNPPQAVHLRDEALRLLPTLLPDERLWLHWGLVQLAFPFFRDVSATIGRLVRLQEQFTLGQVTDRIIATWGERSTLIRASQRLLRSCIDWGALYEADAPGVYGAVPSHQTPNISLRDWFLEAALRAHETDGVPAIELARLPEIYPFVLTVQTYELVKMERFEMQQQGSGVAMIYPAYSGAALAR